MSISGAKKPSKGRPPKDSEAVNVRIDRDMLSAIDDWRRSQSDLPTRPEAVRRMLNRLLKRATEPTAAEIAQYCRTKGRPDLAQVIEAIAWHSTDPAAKDLPLLTGLGN